MREWKFLVLIVLLAALLEPRLSAQASGTPPAARTGTANLAGDWQGTFHDPSGDQRLVFRISTTPIGWRALAYVVSGPPYPSSIPVVTLDGDTVAFTAHDLFGSYSGKLTADGASIVGRWTHGSNPKQGYASQDLTLARATKATAWVIPKWAMPAVMDAKLDPSFEVTTVKPHDPSVPGGGWRWAGARRFSATMTVAQLIEDIYGIEKEQLIDAPSWADKDVYDYAGVPDMPGLPTQRQRYNMERKMLEDRFQLKVHTEKRVFSVLELSVAKGGSKMTPNAVADPGSWTTMRMGPSGGLLLDGRNESMGDTTRLLQRLLDRPVVDETGFTGQFDFDLRFTPDDSMFGGHFPPNNNPDAPPGFFTAMQEQLGLKLTSKKELVDVVVIDHLERPSPN